jgi:hypothetical protein
LYYNARCKNHKNYIFTGRITKSCGSELRIARKCNPLYQLRFLLRALFYRRVEKEERFGGDKGEEKKKKKGRYLK